MPLLAERPLVGPEHHALQRDDARARAARARWRLTRWIFWRAADAHELRRLEALLVRFRRGDPLEAHAWQTLRNPDNGGTRR